MNLIRKHKISLITGIPLSGIDKDIIDFLENKLSNLKIVSYYHSDTYYIKDGKILLQHDLKYNRLICKWKDFWYDLEKLYKLEFKEIQLIIKYMVNRFENIKVDGIVYQGYHRDIEWFNLEKEFGL